MHPFHLSEPKTRRVPIVLSVPHCGTHVPEDLKKEFKQEYLKTQDDTDFLVDQLYDFANSMGITMISAVYSRWVIDLNRDPENKKLYTDGRNSTSLCTTATFSAEPIYKDERSSVDDREVQERLKKYYLPYHNKTREILNNLKSEFGQVLLWDCHSNRQFIPQIYKNKIPDLILSDVNGKSCDPTIAKIAFDTLTSSKYNVSKNHPFMGGYITRHFGKPDLKEHALQLEMSKTVYMDESETKFVKEKADRIRIILKQTLQNIIEHIG